MLELLPLRAAASVIAGSEAAKPVTIPFSTREGECGAAGAEEQAAVLLIQTGSGRKATRAFTELGIGEEPKKEADKKDAKADKKDAGADKKDAKADTKDAKAEAGKSEASAANATAGKDEDDPKKQAFNKQEYSQDWAKEWKPDTRNTTTTTTAPANLKGEASRRTSRASTVAVAVAGLALFESGLRDTMLVAAF